MKKLLSAVILAVAASPSFAAEGTGEPVFDFLSSDSFGQCTQTSVRFDHADCPAWSFSSYTGYLTMSNYDITANYYDDFLVSPDLALETGCQYVVTYKPTLYSSLDEGNANIDLLLGQGDDVETYTTLKVVKNVPYEGYGDDPIETHEVKFTVPATGDYRVAFRGYPSRLYLKTANITSLGSSAEPMAAQNLKVTPDAGGALNVTVTFDVPTTTITGQPLTDVTYNLYRGVQKIKNAVAVTPGETVTYSEKRGEAGVVTYGVEIVCGENISQKMTAQSYIGPETPEAPADVTLSVSGAAYTVSWTAPSLGTHGVELLPDNLSYDVTRILDGTATTVAEGLKACSFTEEVIPAGLQTLRYSVTAKYGATAPKVSAAAECAPIRIGSVTLPVSESFAGAQFNPLWDNEIVTQGSNVGYPWKALEKVDTRMIATEAYDHDGGLGYYNSYNIQRNNSARLVTPPISFAAGDKPVISFAMYHISSGNDCLKVQVSCDYGEWTDVPEAVFTPKGEPADAWTVHTVEFASLIPEGVSTYRVGLLAESAYGQDIVIDNVRLFKLLDKDLETSISADATEVKAGKELTLTVQVANNGVTAVAAGDYSLDIDTNYPGEIDLGELRDIPSLGSVTYTVTIPMTSLHVYSSDTYTFAAEAKTEGDEAADNNRSEDASVKVTYSAGTPASDFTGKCDPDGAVTLSWTAAKDLTYEPVNIVESFEDEAFADGSTGPFNGWTVIDLDGRGGSTWYTATGSTFNLAKNVSTPGSTKDGNNVLGVTVAASVQQNDWIISPRLNCNELSTMQLEFLLGMKQNSGYSYTYKVELLYTTDESYDMLNPQNNFTQNAGLVSSTSYNDKLLPQDNKMHAVEFTSIPGAATYVALHFISKSSYESAMWVDNIRLTEVEENPLLGYHIYDIEAGVRINETLIPDDATSFVLPDGAATFSTTRNAFVTAVYPDGEAAPSNIYDINMATSGVEAVSVESDEGDTRYYNLNGIEMNARNLAPGIYIRRTGTTATKVVVR